MSLPLHFFSGKKDAPRSMSRGTLIEHPSTDVWLMSDNAGNDNHGIEAF